MSVIFHICPRSAWNYATLREAYVTESLQREGFIHASKKNQILTVAKAHYSGQEDLVILVIDSKKLKADMKLEKLTTKEAYPHIYGALNLDAVIEVAAFSCNEKGVFELPSALHKYD